MKKYTSVTYVVLHVCVVLGLAKYTGRGTMVTILKNVNANNKRLFLKLITNTPNYV